MYKHLLVRYGELGLKGKNKIRFIQRLTRNIKNALSDMGGVDVRYTWGRIWVSLAAAAQLDEAIERLQKVFGIYSISPVLQCPREATADDELRVIGAAALQVLRAALPSGGTFKVETRRADKSFPLPSPEVTKRVASYLFDNIDENFSADMYKPQVTVDLEIREEGSYVYGQSIAGAKGFPVGSSGKAMLLLSGGIDSPVAGWMAMKRGVIVEAVHFYSFPFTGEQSKQKVIDLCRLLSVWRGAGIKLHVAYFTDIQKAIREHCPEEYGITIMRRMMFRIAERLGTGRQCLALVTGESIGQVASQTLESMSVINNAVSIPVLRPLVGMDKEEIIAVSEHLGAFDISIRPYEDCCTVFLPPHPVIRPRITEAERYEQSLDIERLISESLAKSETITIYPA